MFQEYITNHIKKLEAYLNTYDFELNFLIKTKNDECCSHIKYKFEHNFLFKNVFNI